MKVIDLLNKIENEEGLPDKIKVECVNSINEHNCYYHFSPIFESYINDDNTLIQNATNLATLLNLEIEIIEEEPRNIEVCGSLFTKSEYDKLARIKEEEILTTDDLEFPITYNEMKIWKQVIKEHNKINKIIKAINEMREDK